MSAKSKSNRVSLFIAQRYFKERGKSNKKQKGVFSGKNFIRFLTNLSMFGVSIGTAALVIVLSVFNGLEDLTKSMFRMYNPELKISTKRGKSFSVTTDFIESIERVPHVEAVTEVIEDNALLRYNEQQLVATVKGVGDNFLRQGDLSEYLVSGNLELHQGSTPRVILGAGVAYQLSVQLNNQMIPLQIWYPKRDKKLSLNPDRAFYRKAILPSGVFSLEQSYDFTHVFVPIQFMESLLKYEGRRTALEVKVASANEITSVQKQIKSTLGDDFLVETAEEQQASILRAVKLERLFGFITFAIILGIASFNVFFSLAMLTIEKRRDIAVLLTMGATAKTIRSIFLLEGAIIAIIGGGLGLVIGFLLCFAQQQFGIVSLGVATSVVEAYPVKMNVLDFIFSAITVVCITLLAAYIPAQKATRIQIAKEL